MPAINFYNTQLSTFWFYEHLESIFLFIRVETMLCYMCILNWYMYMSNKNTDLSAVYAIPNFSSFDRLMLLAKLNFIEKKLKFPYQILHDKTLLDSKWESP